MAPLKDAPGKLVTVAIGYATPEEVIPVGIPTTHIGAIDNVTVKIFDPAAGDKYPSTP